ncbi:MAG: LytTR family DNA-binding domain-containing protein [Cytophagales bacterium]|nr:LytTR family DNA-binding domain-containing protein [Cytophagales bacterium]
MKAIIVDDEIVSCETLKILLEENCKDLKIVDACQSVDRAVISIEANRPDIVFLDVQMNNETGFDLLLYFKDKASFEVIFTTAHSEFAIKAIRFSAIDYLLKPISVDELISAVKSAEKKIHEKESSNQKILNLLKNLEQKTTSNYKIALPSSSGLIFLDVKYILYCEGKENYTKIHTTESKTYLISKTLRKFEDMLSDLGFYRIHKTYLVNLNEINEYIKGMGGQVVLSDATILDVSRRKREGLLSMLYRPAN